MYEKLFDGDEPKATVTNIQENLFFYAGQLMAQSLLQGGPTPNILSKTSFKVLCAKSNHAQFTKEEIPDSFKERPLIKKVFF